MSDDPHFPTVTSQNQELRMAPTMICDPSQAVFNRQTALQRIGGDEQLLHDLALFYLEDAPALLTQLQDAMQQADAEGVTHAAHTLKSLSANLDAHQAAALASIVERIGRSGNLASAPDLLAELDAAVHAVLRSLRASYSDLR
jgi:HPt (histidine-containing phosphotransfer) domain-containing protein